MCSEVAGKPGRVNERKQRLNKYDQSFERGKISRI
jgi:hypothetical protein